MKRYFTFLVCLLCAGSALADKVDSYIKEQMKNGHMMKEATYGSANLELKMPVGRDTLFEVGAITKQFTATGILMLKEEGRLSLDARIASYLNGTPEGWSNITVRQLMNHTSGIKSFTDTTNGFRLSDYLTQQQFI